MGWGSRAHTPTRSGRFLLLDVCAWTIMTGPIEICVFACKDYTIGDTKYIYEWSVGNYSRCMEYRLYMCAVSHEDATPFLSYQFCWPRLAPMDDIDGVDVDDHAKIPRTPLQKDLLGLVAFPFVSYALCRFLQLHSYPCLNSHVWIVLLGNEQLVELSLELGNRLLPWISFLTQWWFLDMIMKGT